MPKEVSLVLHGKANFRAPRLELENGEWPGGPESGVPRRVDKA
jgi:hypothetical protein